MRIAGSRLGLKRALKGYFVKGLIASIIALFGAVYTGLYAGSFFCNFAENYSQEHKKKSPTFKDEDYFLLLVQIVLVYNPP